MQITVKNNFPILNEAILKGFSEGLRKGGHILEAKMAEQVASGMTPPPNAPATIAKKHSSGTLVNTGEMYGAISSEVRDNGKSVVVGVMGNEVAATKALINEFGAPAAGIPERSFIRRTANDKSNRDGVNQEVITVMRTAIKEAIIK